MSLGQWEEDMHSGSPAARERKPLGFIYSSTYWIALLSDACNSPHRRGCLRCRLNAQRQMRRGHSTQTHWTGRRRVTLSACLSISLSHECLSCCPTVKPLSVNRVKVSDMFSGLDWPRLCVMTGYPNLLLPRQRCWQHQRLDVPDCMFFSVCDRMTEWGKRRKN